MIIEIYIRNFILIDELRIPMSKGLNVITGETGAGKSMILGALDVLFGGRADKSLIRRSGASCEIGASLDISLEQSGDIAEKLREYGIDPDEDLVTVSREIKSEGKNVSRINGRIVPVGVVRDLADAVLEVTSQSDQLRLFTPHSQLSLLDSYIGSSIEPFKAELFELHKSISDLKREFETLDVSDEEINRNLDLLLYQMDEIEKSNLRDDEDIDLEDELKLFSNYRSICEGYEKIDSLFDGSGGIVSSMSRAMKAVADINSMRGNGDELFGRLESAYYEVESIYESLRSDFSDLNYDEERATFVEERLDLINSLKRKYGKTIADIKGSLDSMKTEYNDFMTISERKGSIEKEFFRLKEEYFRKASELSAIRNEGADRFSDEITSSLKDLNFTSAQLVFAMSQNDSISRNGIDDVDILVSMNLGQGLSPLEKAASGGELSRIMLAIKSIIGANQNKSVIIFDEIDAGISGVAATKVAGKLKLLSRYSQVIAITHLPQIAAFGDSHLLVEKIENEAENTTLAVIRKIEDNERVLEIARIATGGLTNDKALESARHMIQSARAL